MSSERVNYSVVGQQESRGVVVPVLTELGLQEFIPEKNATTSLKVRDKEKSCYKLNIWHVGGECIKSEFNRAGALFLGLQEEAYPAPVGYLNFSLSKNKPVAVCSTSFCVAIKEKSVWPASFRNLKEVAEGELTALRIFPNYEELGLGSLIWMVGLGVLEGIGREACVVRRDVTGDCETVRQRKERIQARGKSIITEPTGSFYLGRANKSRVRIRVANRGIGPRKELILPTRLTAEQQMIIKRGVTEAIPKLPRH